MRTITFAFLFSLLTVVSSAQELGHIGFGGPKTRLIVLNEVSDGTLLWAQIGGQATKQPIGPGGQWSRGFTYGTNGSVEVRLTVCPVHETVRNSVIEPPEWAMNEKLGANALTEEFLRSDPSEKDVRKRVEGIEKSLDGRLGRREKISELEGWLRTVRQSGLTPAATSCRNRQVDTFVQDVSQWGYGRTITIVVHGSLIAGYRHDIKQ
ncbi:MAG: hypothetical protein WCF77_01250 [Minisyncoccia bacterium]|jgi:hypothetical protein